MQRCQWRTECLTGVILITTQRFNAQAKRQPVLETPQRVKMVVLCTVANGVVGDVRLRGDLTNKLDGSFTNRDIR